MTYESKLKKSSQVSSSTIIVPGCIGCGSTCTGGCEDKCATNCATYCADKCMINVGMQAMNNLQR